MSAPKSVGVLFTQKRDDPKVSLKILNKDIDIKKSAKFLGIVFDSRLNWWNHINYIIDRCKGRLNLLRCISGCKWGANCKNLINLYKALIRPIFEYGARRLTRPQIPLKGN